MLGEALLCTCPTPLPLLAEWLPYTVRKSMLLWTQSSSSYRNKYKNMIIHCEPEVSIESSQGKEETKFLFRVNLNYWRQNIDYKSLPSLPFFIPFSPYSKETQAGPNFYSTANDTCFFAQVSAKDSLDGFDSQVNHPEPHLQSTWSWPLKITYHPGSQSITASILRLSELSLDSEQMIVSKNETVLGSFPITSYNIVISFTC